MTIAPAGDAGRIGPDLGFPRGATSVFHSGQLPFPLGGSGIEVRHAACAAFEGNSTMTSENKVVAHTALNQIAFDCLL